MTDNFTLISETLLVVMDVLNLKIAEIELNSLNTTYHDNDELSRIYCNDRGNWKENICSCDLGYFGKHCLISGLFYWGNGWTTLQVLFSIVYGILCIFTWIYFKRSITEVI